MKVIVASKNPVKIEATRIGFQKMFPGQEFEVIGISAPSDVNDQPMSREETYLGAKNRAYNAEKIVSDADFRVGIESGLGVLEDETYTQDRIVILSQDKLGQQKIGRAQTGNVFLPKKVAELIHTGMELGKADDIVFQKENSKQGSGAVGILTGNAIIRTDFLVTGVVCALVSFKNPDLY